MHSASTVCQLPVNFPAGRPTSVKVICGFIGSECYGCVRQYMNRRHE